MAGFPALAYSHRELQWLLDACREIRDNSYYVIEEVRSRFGSCNIDRATDFNTLYRAMESAASTVIWELARGIK